MEQKLQVVITAVEQLTKEQKKILLLLTNLQTTFTITMQNVAKMARKPQVVIETVAKNIQEER